MTIPNTYMYISRQTHADISVCVLYSKKLSLMEINLDIFHVSIKMKPFYFLTLVHS